MKQHVSSCYFNIFIEGLLGFFCIVFCCDKNVIHFDVFIVPYNGNIKYNTNGTDSEMQLHYG